MTDEEATAADQEEGGHRDEDSGNEIL